MWNRILGFGFHLLYHQFARCYDLIAWLVSLGQWRTWAQTALPYVLGDKVLELGHGPGHLLVELANQGYRPAGVDSSRQMTQLACRRLRQASLAIRPIHGRGEHLPFSGNTFDSVVATFPTAFILQPPTLFEVARVLRPGGRLVVVLGAQLTRRDPISRFIAWLYAITGQSESIDGDSWKLPFEAAGLTVSRVDIERKGSRVWLLLADRFTPDDKD